MELLLAAATTSFDGSSGGQEGDLAAREIHEIQKYQHAERSVRVYRNMMVRYLRWVVENKPELATESFTASLKLDKSDSPTKKSILATFESAPASPPLYFANLEPDDFLKWVHSQKNERTGLPLSYSSYCSMRTAFNYLCEIYEWKVPEIFEENCCTYFGGLKRTLAKETADGTGKSTKGKQPISMRLYRRLAEVMLRSPTRDRIFARAFMLLTWNLMARAGSTAAACFSHLEWGEDAMRVYFAHSKTDQLGTRPRDPRHVYVNPIQPELCPILALGVFWLSYEYSPDDLHLFPGDRQSNRFHDILTRTLKLPEVDLANEERANLGTHSFRKGSSSYASCGSTAGPSATAVHIRAGWSLGAIQNCYLRHVDAGDMYVGRTLAGLPIMEPEFASGPPHFLVSTEPSARAVENAMSICFPILPVSARTIGGFALASLVYHAAFLKSRLPPTHPVLVSALFRNAGILHRLQRLLAPPGSVDITLTGIPPHVVLQQKVRDLTGDVMGVTQHLALRKRARSIQTPSERQFPVPGLRRRLTS